MEAVSSAADRPIRHGPWAPLALVFLAGEAQARASEEVLRALGSGFGRISPLGLILCGLGVIVILGILVVMEIVRTDTRQREKIDVGWQYFTEMAGQKRLIPQEIELLKRIVECGGISSADMVFDSSFIYEDSLEAFMKANAGKLEKDETLYPQLRGLRVKLGYAQLPAEIPISSTRQFEEGMPVTLADGDEPRRGRVLEVGEKIWVVALEGEIPPSIAPGGAVEVSVLRAGDGEYATRITVAGTRLSTQTVFLKHTRALERKQMRNWVRIDVNIPCRVTVISKPEIPLDGGHPGPPMGMVLEGRLLDLSGGGACARFPSPIPQGHKLSLNFDLPGTSLRGMQSEVMRLTAVQKNGREDYEHNLKFLTMETAFQEKIVRYVFEKQRLDSQMRGPIRAE